MLNLNGNITPHQYMQSLGKVTSELTTDEIAQFVIYMRDELYDNKLQASPATLGYLADIAHQLCDNNSKSNWAANMGSIGGSAKTESKTSASRENGKLGGRPRKNPDTNK